MVFAGRRPVSPGQALMLLGVGHAAWAGIAYHRPVLGLSVIGTVLIPRSGFPIAAPFEYGLLRRAREPDAPNTVDRRATWTRRNSRGGGRR